MTDVKKVPPPVTDLGDSELLRQMGWKKRTVFSWCVDYDDPSNPYVGLTATHEEDDIVTPAPTATEIMNELPAIHNNLYLYITRVGKSYDISYCTSDGNPQLSTEAETLEAALARMWQRFYGEDPLQHNTTTTHINVALLVYDYEEDFSKLTHFLGLTPTTTHEADEEQGTVRRWELQSGANESAEFEEHLAILLKQLEPRKKEVREIASKYRCVISVGIHYYEFNPEIELTPEAIKALADLGVKLWLDMYNMWDGDSDHDYHERKPGISKL